MGGTRYNARGIDHEGNVANHVELEQLVFQHEVHDPPIPFEDQPNSHILGSTTVYSHVQIRGSLPFFWTQAGLTSVALNQPAEVSLASMQKHYDAVRSDMNDGQIVSLNLIQKGKAMEKLLLDEYEKLVHESGLEFDYLSYYHFDFHMECHENSTPMMDFITERLYSNHI